MDLNKHNDFFNPTKTTDTIHIIGIGALGSNLAHSLVRLGFDTFIIYDFDNITPHNLTNQYYFNDQIGELKTDSLVDNLHRINPDAVVIKEDKYEEQALDGIVFLCLDSIEERKRILTQNLSNHRIKLLIDMRIGLEEGQCFTTPFSGFKRMLTTMQFKNGESKAPRNACGSTLSILPTIQMITSLAITNLIHYYKHKSVYNMIFIDSIDGVAKKIMEIKI